MSGMQRRKGARGELELAGIIAELTGWQVKRKVRQHENDYDLEGIPGWAAESKRHKAAGRAEIASWWRQTVRQATHLLPVLFYRLDRDSWRAVWPVSPSSLAIDPKGWGGYEYTVEGSIEAWAAVARELVT